MPARDHCEPTASGPRSTALAATAQASKILHDHHNLIRYNKLNRNFSVTTSNSPNNQILTSTTSSTSNSTGTSPQTTSSNSFPSRRRSPRRPARVPARAQPRAPAHRHAQHHYHEHHNHNKHQSKSTSTSTSSSTSTTITSTTTANTRFLLRPLLQRVRTSSTHVRLPLPLRRCPPRLTSMSTSTSTSTTSSKENQNNAGQRIALPRFHPPAMNASSDSNSTSLARPRTSPSTAPGPNFRQGRLRRFTRLIQVRAKSLPDILCNVDSGRNRHQPIHHLSRECMNELQETSSQISLERLHISPYPFGFNRSSPAPIRSQRLQQGMAHQFRKIRCGT